MLTIQHISFRFDGVEALRDVSLCLKQGEFVAILGPNGSGKTTLLRNMAGVLTPQSGQVLLQGRPISSFGARERARLMAWVPQGVHADLAFTALETVLMGRYAYHSRFASDTQEDIARARAALQEAGAAHYAGKKVTELSGGELQRVLVARALCQGSPILLLDEPVSNLDIRHQVDILQVIAARVQCQNALAVCVLHDLNLAAHYAHRIILMHQGQIVADGSPRQVLTASRLEAVYGIPLHQAETPEGPVWVPAYDSRALPD